MRPSLRSIAALAALLALPAHSRAAVEAAPGVSSAEAAPAVPPLETAAPPDDVPPAEPPAPMAEPTPPPPPEAPAPPQVDTRARSDAQAYAGQAAQPQRPGSGQWVYTEQYGWVWMPYGDAYTWVPPDGYGQPYNYVYYPAAGWTWVVAPWVWGWGPWPYFGAYGPSYFAWYRFGWWRTPHYWHYAPAFRGFPRAVPRPFTPGLSRPPGGRVGSGGAIAVPPPATRGGGVAAPAPATRGGGSGGGSRSSGSPHGRGQHR